uniref:Uncharacterized protein n=1 Tax=Arundo donax TaxID=35708 RepID=A0A0A9G3A6_ARUDO
MMQRQRSDFVYISVLTQLRVRAERTTKPHAHTILLFFSLSFSPSNSPPVAGIQPQMVAASWTRGRSEKR